jgi:hypothetical protein
MEKAEIPVALKGAGNGLLLVVPVMVVSVAIAATAVLLLPTLGAVVAVENHRKGNKNVTIADRVALWKLCRSSEKAAKAAKAAKASEAKVASEGQEAGVPAPAMS